MLLSFPSQEEAVTSRALRGVPIVALLAPTAVHADMPERALSVDGFVGTSAVGDGFGRDFKFGGGLALRVSRDYQVRAEVDSFDWQRPGRIEGVRETFFYTEDLRNTMLFAGVRRYFGRSKFRPYAELGFGYHWLEFERSFGDGLSRPEKEEKAGGVLGVGVEVNCEGHVCLGFSVRYRIIGSGVGERDDVPTRSWRVGVTVSLR